MSQYPRYIVLFPSLLVRVDSLEQELRLRRSEARLIGWSAVVGLVGGIFLGWLLA